MSDTALIDEVREIRHRIAAECDNDLVKIAQRAAEAAKRSKVPVLQKGWGFQRKVSGAPLVR